jgi:hypothetical protein
MATLRRSEFAGQKGAARSRLRKRMPLNLRRLAARPSPFRGALVRAEEAGVVTEYVLKMVEEGGHWKVGK